MKKSSKDEWRKKIKAIEKATYIDQEMLVGSRNFFSRRWLVLRRQFLSYYFLQPPLWRVLVRSKSKEPRMSPSFLSLGAVRSGTTLFSDYIMQHPCVALPLAKEIGVGRFPVERYLRAQMPTIKEGEAIRKDHGKVITGYCSPAIPHAGFAHLSSQIAAPDDTKIVIILRDPVERTFAHWRWDSALLKKIKADSLWNEFPNFDGAMQIELDYISQGGGGMTTASGTGGGGYIQHSIYLPFLKVLNQYYPRQNILFIKSEDFFEAPIAIAKQGYAFLDLPEYEPIKVEVKNTGPVKEIMSEGTRALLTEFFKPKNKALYEYIGRDLNW